MRILQVSDMYPPVPGGLELAVASISAELARRGHEVGVLTQAGMVPAGSTTEDGVLVRRVKGVASAVNLGYADDAVRFHPPAPDPWVVAAVREELQRFRPDVVHAHGWIAYSVLAALPRRGGPVCVVGLHDYSRVCPKKTFVDATGAACSGPALGKCLACASAHFGAARGVPVVLATRASASLYRRADSMVANSEAVADASSRPRGSAPVGAGPAGAGPAARCHPVIEVIPPPVRSARGPLKRPSFLPEADGFVMFAGALAPNKGIGVLLDAHERGGLGAPLVVIGPRRHDSPTRWPAGVTVAHDVSHDEVLGAWPHAAVAVVPSVWPEPFGMVAVEAMHAGVPVVASATGGLVDIVEDGVTGLLVPPGDGAALAAAVRKLVENPDQAQAMGRAGAARAERFAAGRVVDRLEDFYRRRVLSAGRA